MSKTTLGTRKDSFKTVKSYRGDRHNQIINAMKDNGNIGFTAKELAVILFEKGLTPSEDRNQTHPRLNELVSAGRVYVAGKKKDESTNRMVAFYKLPN